MDRLPAGTFARDVLYAVSYVTDIRVAKDGSPADRIQYEGETYEIQEVQNSGSFLGQAASVMFTAINVQALEVKAQ